MTGQKVAGRQWLAAAGVLLLVALTLYGVLLPWMLGPSKLNTIYGQRKSRARSSVNGTSVFARIFQQRGARVTTWMQLSPRLQRSDAIVWVPNSFELPTDEQIKYLEEEWLGLDDQRFRTLIYVARDYDAAIEYWASQADGATGSNYIAARRQLARATADHAYARALTARTMECDWFSIEPNQRFTQVRPTAGTWATELDIRGARISVAGEMKLPEEEDGRTYEVLLGSAETPLIARITDEHRWPNSQVIVVLNGASLLNLPLVEHANREIAARLIDECQDPYRVTFLESGPAGLRISNRDPNAYSGFEALTVWPINVILLHFVVAGILFCVMVFPIFGRPRKIVEDPPNNFGKHIEAMGQLLSLSGNRKAAISRIQHYRNLKLDPAVVGAPSTHEAGNPFKT